MAISDAVQTLSAAFAFGILLQAAVGALFIYYRGHGSTIFQDGRRLVLILFLLFAALWAQIQFLNLLLTNTMATACQATIIISTMFDQLARLGIEQFLLWSVGHGTKLTAERLILQGILLVRMIGGGVLVGFARPQFAPVCMAQSTVTPLAVVVLALDAIIIGVLMIRAMSLGMFRELREKSSSTRQEQSKALILAIVGLGVWTGTSVPMILGIPSISLMARTVLPGNGILVLIAVVTMFPGALLLAREEVGTTPEATSPFVTPMPPRELFGDSVRSNGSPVSTNTYTKNGSLFVVNPSNTPHDSPTAVFQSSSRGDTRGFTKLGNEIDVQEINDTPPERPDRLAVRGPGYRGSSGVFPSMIAASQLGVQAALAPQIRPSVPPKVQNAATFPAPVLQQKRSMFNWSKPAPPKPSIRTLQISNPVALDISGGAPQPKMQTIDLATAASMERERREEASARLKLVANRPAPQPPQFSTQEAFRRSVSVRRKEMPTLPVEAMPAVPTTSVSGLSVVATNGSTSSASLSPGREEVRRRSPRQTNSFDQTFSEKAVNPTLQRKRTVGLPSNPRSTRITMAQEASIAKPQTVMLMNDVVYDNPALVKTIIKDAPGMYAAAQKTRNMEKSAFSETTTSLKASNSVIHRPRPYKREKNEDRALFPSEPSPGHRRSRSGSSITVRKSFLMSEPGSPTLLPRLPPLPPPPITSAANLKRLLPNDTKSMTFDEKIELLFPAPPGPVTIRSRRSSVPSLPRLPSVFMSETPMVQSPTGEELHSRRASKRTTIASFAIPEIKLRPRSPKRQTTRPEEVQGYRYSAHTYRSIADEVGETWIPGISSENVDNSNNLLVIPQRQSVVNDSRQSHWTEASDESSVDDATTYWGSVHSKVLPVDLAKATHNAHSLYIQRPDIREQRESASSIPAVPQLHDLRRCEAFVPLILDAEAKRGTVSFRGNDNRRSFLLDADQSLPGDKTPSSIKNENVIKIEHGWHHRIGDELPTFSERSHPKGRKMPPPTPLLLSKNGKKATVVVRPSEPSPPTDSPERAIADIQAQLRRFEDEPSRGSVGSLLRHMPGNQTESSPDTGRLRLLDNLEKEMGQQETHWQQMHTNLDRDSMSQAMSPYTQAQSEESEGTLTRESSQRSNRTPSKILSRRARVRSSMSISERTTSTSSSDNSRASIWQQRLAEAQIEYMENAPALLRKKSLNFLSISKGQAPMMSPTPPESVESETDIETDLESDSDTEAMMKYQAPQASMDVKPKLWEPSLPSPKAASGRMWNPPYETLSASIVGEPPAMNVRPAQRRLENSLPISSTQLWTKPRSSQHSRAVVGLWGSKTVRPRSINTRPLTQRPQRKSRRITFLPDIVESPVPLPNKRETLGIFQFPWGETSDQPIYQPAYNPTMIAGSALAPKLDARSKQLEPDQTEYSSSFFDDYEEEDEELDIESDDDFDETTLWEIANLLHSRDVPSKASLLPAAREIIDDYDMDSAPESPDSAVPPPVSRLPIQPLAMISRSVAQLWAGDSSPPLGNVAPGLPQPESTVWDALIPAKEDIVRSKPRTSLTTPTLSSTDLWAAPREVSSFSQASFMWSSDAAADVSPVSTSTTTSETTSPSLMWSPKADISEDRSSGMFTIPSKVIRSTNASPAAIKMVKVARPSTSGVPSISSNNLWSRLQNLEEATGWITKSSKPRDVLYQKPSTLMWAPASKTSDVIILGLFDVTVPRSNYRSSEAIPAAINMICKPRTSLQPLSQLTSTRLWRKCQDKFPIEHHWISESSTRPESPSYSTASSGNSSPISDSSSVKSTSTKGSSIWSFSTIPTWWDRKSKNSPALSPQDDSKQPSKIPVRQAPTPLVPVRESRVLASRDLWESRAPVLDNTPVKNLRRGTIVQQSAIPILKTLPSQHRRPVAVRADWDSALAEAIAAGSLKKTVTRLAAKKSDWESALSEALSQSQLRLQRPVYNSAKWEAALDEAISACIVTPSYDASILHPVFFTSSLVSSASDIHPAAIGYVMVKVAQPSMWTPTSAPSIPKPAMLWSKDSVIPQIAVSEMRVVREPGRKAPAARHIQMPVLESRSFWQPSQVVLQERNWLIAATKKKSSAQTWVPTAALPVSHSVAMWVAMPASSQTTPDIFAYAKGSYIKQASSTRPDALTRLNSNELFDSSAISTPKSMTHWLHETSATASTAQSLTWSASSTITPANQETIMWQPQSTSTIASPALFINPHAETWSRAKRTAEALVSIESTDLWRPSRDLPESPKNWLVKRRFSKVEFRY